MTTVIIFAMARLQKNSSLSRRQGKDKSPAGTKVPDIYKEMLAETVSSATDISNAGKIIKRRRVAGQIVTHDQDSDQLHGLTDDLNHHSSIPNDAEHVDMTPTRVSANQQTAYHDSEDSAESDLDWEEVDLKEGLDEDSSLSHVETQSGELNLVLGEENNKSREQGRSRKLPVTAAEKQMRLEIHKMHILCLLVHVHLRNHWCNGEEVQVR